MERAPFYQEVNKAFQNTSKVLFGQSIGELKEFDNYLSETMNPYDSYESKLSGKEVIVNSYYPEDAAFISADEVAALKRQQVDINSIKDIDSLVEAVKDTFAYSGNQMFGLNSNLWLTTAITDSHYIIKSHNVVKTKYASNCCYTRECSHIFGLIGNPYSEYTIRCSMGGHLKRCFEAYSCDGCSDLYYCFRCDGSTDCMFSFGFMGGRYVIGNNHLTREQYLELKAKLVNEIAEELKTKKQLPSILDLPQHYGFVNNARQDEERLEFEECQPAINEAFGKTSRVILGESLSPMQEHKEWLYGINLFDLKKIRAAFGMASMKHSYGGFKKLHPERLVQEEEFFNIAKRAHLSKSNKSLEEVMHELAKIIYFTCSFTVTPSSNIVDTPYSLCCNDMYVAIGVQAKYVAFAVGIKCNYVFGGLGRIVQSNFDINCYDSVNITRCFESDASYNSSDLYYCHNCENVNNAIFSFNIKNKQYAVGNTMVGKEQFLRTKKILLDYVLERIKTKDKVSELHLFSVPKWR